MSYEGYEQWLCGQGHLTIYDCYESPERLNWKCPVCQSGVALVDCVDQTNDSGNPMKFEVFIPAEICHCEKCGNQHVIEPTRYVVPEKRKRS